MRWGEGRGGGEKWRANKEIVIADERRREGGKEEEREEEFS